MQKVDLTTQYKSYYTAKSKPEIVDIEPAQFLSFTGKGDPSGKEFENRIQALYTTAYAIKFISKSAMKDFTVSKLEGLWWFDSKKFTVHSFAEAPLKIPRQEWEYRLLIRLPDFVTEQQVHQGIDAGVSKKQLPLCGQTELFKMQEGKCVQMLHVGPFSTEAETLQKIDEFIKANHFSSNGLHHEIYLSDFRKTAPDKLKTILREPVK